MNIYEADVDGASPGIGGVIRVVAPSKRVARLMIADELARINEERAASGYPVCWVDEVVRVKSFGGQGVVYSYDGEA